MIYSKKERLDLYISAVGLWGVEKQKMMLIEECAELIQAMSKSRRYEYENADVDLIDELADVKIMIEQMEAVYGIEDIVETQKQQKLERLSRRIETAKELGI